MSNPEKIRERRPSSSKGNRLTQFFSSSPKSKEHTQQALLAMQQHHHNQQAGTATSTGISSSTVSLPTISLSAAAGAELSSPDAPTTTLFEPKTAEEAERQRRADAQFGPLSHPSHLYTSKSHGQPLAAPIEDDPPYYALLTTYVSYLILIVIGHIRDFFGKRFGDKKHYNSLKVQNGYAPLNDDFDSFYTRRLKLRLDDCFARTITGVPGRYITLLDRKSDDFNRTYQYTGTTTETLNMSSYNYLGFAQSEGPCADAVEEFVKRKGVTTFITRAYTGTTKHVLE
jgi:serine palmitoyltransferase